MAARIICFAALLMFAFLPVPTAFAHVGTTAVFVQGNAGPYVVYVTVTPPAVIPGEAQVSVVTEGASVRTVAVQANVLGSDAARYLPEAQTLRAVGGGSGSRAFNGTIWLMTQGSWQVRVAVKGDRGEGVLAVPVPAEPTRLMTMSRPFGALLIVLGALLIAGLGAIAAAFVREAGQEPGSAEDAPAAARRSGRWAAAYTVAGCVVLLALGERLWRQEIARYGQNIYRPLEMRATVHNGVLQLRLQPPRAVEEVFATRRLDDLALDHNHLMHLYAVRWPAMDEVLHLHPEQVSAGDFQLTLPGLHGGEYRLFADVVHADGIQETAVATVSLPAGSGRPLAGDDAGGLLPEFGAATPGKPTADGFRFQFQAVTAEGGGVGRLIVGRPVLLRFTLLTPEGKAPADMRDYMGMAGHVAVIRQDGSVFAHIHPNGTAAMAAYMLANQDQGGMAMPAQPPTNVATFPFGFPSAGRYRLIVQMRHGETIETGADDVDVR